VLAELRFGIELLIVGTARRADLENWVTQTIRPMFDQRILPATEGVRLLGGCFLKRAERPAIPFHNRT
jgi:hypothetical protein